MESVDLKLRQFNLSQMRPYALSVVVGKRGSGKSTFMNNLMYAYRHVPLCIVISPTNEVNQEFSSMVPSSFIHDEFRKEIIQQLITRQKKLIQKTKGRDRKNDVILILNDFSYNPEILKTQEMRNLAMAGRHYQIYVFLLLQYVKDLPPAFRCNADYVFLTRDNNKENQKKLHDCFFGVFPTFESFYEVFVQVTQNFGVLCYDNTSLSMDLADYIFWCRGRLHLPPFRFCSDKIWKYCERLDRRKREEARANERHERQQRLTNTNGRTRSAIQKLRRKKTPNINVKYSK